MKTISDVIGEIRSKTNAGLIGREYYFRGQREGEELTPSLLRNDPVLDDIDNYLYCDATVMGRSELTLANNSWEKLATLQHHDVPTRLLDWSSSLVSALFFAFNSCLRCSSILTCSKTVTSKACIGFPIIYVLDPSKMHDKLYPRIINKMAITVGVDELLDYEKEFVVKHHSKNDWKYKNGPVFLEIPWFDTRMQAQKGYFTFHLDKTPLETLLRENDGLIKISIPEDSIKSICEEFTILGINEFDLFRELPSLAHYLKLKYRLK